MVALDLETTHADPELARIVTGTVALVGGGQETEVLEVMVAPEIEIPRSAERVHGISTERARAEGVPPADGIAELLWGLSVGLETHLEALVVFNGAYDLTVLDREARRHGLREALLAVRPGGVVDPLVIDKHVARYRPGSRKLEDACRFYGASLEGAHDSSFDAIAAARLAWVLAEKAQIVRRERNAAEERNAARLRADWDAVRHNLPLLHKRQRAWRRFQAAGLRAYFNEQRAELDMVADPFAFTCRYEESAVVPLDWPLVTTPALRYT